MVSPRAIAQRLQSELLIRILRFRGGVSIGGGVRLAGAPIVDIQAGSRLIIGDRVRLISDPRRATLGTNHPVTIKTLRAGALIDIGDDVGITGGTICSALRVTVGRGTMFGANVTIADTDFHPIDHPDRRYAPLPAPAETDAVDIGVNVFLGAGSIVLKGSSVGDNSVIGAGSVVSGHIPANVVAAGVPARTLRSLDIGVIRDTR